MELDQVIFIQIYQTGKSARILVFSLLETKSVRYVCALVIWRVVKTEAEH